MKPTTEPDVSLVLAVYNESGHLLDELHRIRRAMDAASYSYEIIVVDDGSTDGSGEILRSVEGIRLIQFAQNRGSGAARKWGTKAATGRVVVWTDVDMSYPNEDIPSLIKELDGYDQVIGCRTSEHGRAKLVRVPTKWFMRRLASYLTNAKIPDLNSGLRAFRRDIALQYLHLMPRGFSCVTTMTLAFLSGGYSVKYVPVTYAPRSGTSKFHWWADTKRYLLQIIRMVLIYNPLKVFMPVGLTLLLIGAAKAGYDVAGGGFAIAANTLLIFLAAVAVMMLGLLSDVVVQVGRPRDEVEPTSLP